MSNQLFSNGTCVQCDQFYPNCGKCKQNSFGGVDCLECQNNLKFLDELDQKSCGCLIT